MLHQKYYLNRFFLKTQVLAGKWFLSDSSAIAYQFLLITALSLYFKRKTKSCLIVKYSRNESAFSTGDVIIVSKEYLFSVTLSKAFSFASTKAVFWVLGFRHTISSLLIFLPVLFSLPSISKCQNSNWLLSLLLSDKIAQFNPLSLGGEMLLEQKDK